MSHIKVRNDAEPNISDNVLDKSDQNLHHFDAVVRIVVVCYFLDINFACLVRKKMAT
jgi:hypothetical protein